MIYLQKQVIFNIQNKVLLNKFDKNLKKQRQIWYILQEVISLGI